MMAEVVLVFRGGGIVSFIQRADVAPKTVKRVFDCITDRPNRGAPMFFGDGGPEPVYLAAAEMSEVVGAYWVPLERTSWLARLFGW